jgi:hypothetical protein
LETLEKYKRNELKTTLNEKIQGVSHRLNFFVY